MLKKHHFMEQVLISLHLIIYELILQDSQCTTSCKKLKKEWRVSTILVAACLLSSIFVTKFPTLKTDNKLHVKNEGHGVTLPFFHPPNNGDTYQPYPLKLTEDRTQSQLLVIHQTLELTAGDCKWTIKFQVGLWQLASSFAIAHNQLLSLGWTWAIVSQQNHGWVCQGIATSARMSWPCRCFSGLYLFLTVALTPSVKSFTEAIGSVPSCHNPKMLVCPDGTYFPSKDMKHQRMFNVY